MSIKENANTGYAQKKFEQPTKRYCQMLDLYDDPELIKNYIACHAHENAWPEISKGIRSVGILEMEIYIVNNRLFMIVDTPMDFDWDTAFGKLATLDRQQEWEEYVSKFQVVKQGSSSSEKWTLIDRMFKLLD
jgi:L-rhamnose mutarotase